MSFKVQSKEIAKRYNLIPIEVSQSNMMSYIGSSPNNNYMTPNKRIESAIDDVGTSAIATLSICSYMNPYTPNKRLSLIHSTGTGKTRKVLLAAMQYNRDITIVAVHSVQIAPFITETNSQGPVKALYPWFRKRLEIITCKSVVSAEREGDAMRLDYFFKGRVIIVDEVHHIRSNTEAESPKSSLFDSIVNVLNRYKDSVVFFLSATPLVDTSMEMLGIYKLLKPHSPVESNMQYLAHDLRGYVSYLSKGNLRSRKVKVQCRMTEEGAQWQLYQMHQDDKTSVHNRTMSVSRFITLDDPEASEHPSSTKDIIDSMLMGMVFDKQEDRHKMEIKALKHISIKMYRLVKHLLSHRGYPKFIFDMWKIRGGVDRIVDVLCMPAVGYRCITTSVEALDTTRGPKIVALHKVVSRKSKSSQVKELLDLFNSEENKSGDLIEILIASPMFAESMSLKTAMESHVMMPSWNLTTYMQIMGRVNRRTSLWYMPKEERILVNYVYILCKPDGSPTVESEIESSSKRKYRDIRPLLAIMSESSIGTMYSRRSTVTSRSSFPGITSSRFNNRIRMTTNTINYRAISIDTNGLLTELEKRDNIYELMRDISTQEVGYTRLINVAIQSIEFLYIKRMKKESVTLKQQKLLEDISSAFIEYEGYITHVLYFSNDDTVEYQRLAKERRRIVRVLDTVLNVWVDLVDTGVTEIISSDYDRITESFYNSIYREWAFYGFYVAKFLLTACCRLVRHRHRGDISKSTRKDTVDRRKLSRGEKWQYYNKSVLVRLLSKFTPLTVMQQIVIVKKVPSEAVFQRILSHMSEKGLVLTLPI